MNKTGFGFLRLPLLDPNDETSIDYAALCPLVDRFLELGGSYFDTAFTYLGEKSEEALRKSLVERHPRESFRIADKLPGWKIKHHGECRQYFDTQLRRCGVDYFDVYLIHWLNAENYAICEKTDQFSFLRQIKAEGRAKAIGFSYHDSPELLDRILTEHPEVDYVQLQINYLDWDSISIQSGRCYETAVAHGKRILVMEPVKGGSLVNLPQQAEQALKAYDAAASIPSWAIRFASSLEGVEVVLSGMNTLDQIEDNLRDFDSLSDYEKKLLADAAEIIRANTAIPCTGCGYCASNCPKHIPIPKYFALYNDYSRNPDEDWKMQHVYDTLSAQSAKASECISCRRCEQNCPQKLEIANYLTDVSKAFENQGGTII